MFPVNQSMAFAPPVGTGMFPVAPNTGGFPAPAVAGFPIQQPPLGTAVPQANPFFGMSLGMVPPQGFPVQVIFLK